MDRAEGITLLERHGKHLKVPCSRYGWDTESCAPVAWRAAEIVAAETGTDVGELELDAMMSLVVNDSDEPETLIRDYGTAEDVDALLD